MTTTQRAPKTDLERLKHPSGRIDLAVLVLWIGTLALVVFGVVMVLSSSTVTSYLANQGFLGGGMRQALYAIAGVPLMWFAATRSTAFWRKWAPALFFFGIFLQLLVFTPLGVEVYGNRNWLSLFGVMQIQPSEPLKLALIVMIGAAVSMKERRLGAVKEEFFPVVVPWGLMALGVVMGGQDLGTGMVMAATLIGCMYFADLHWKTIWITIGLGLVGVAYFVLSSPNRLHRIFSHSSGVEDYSGSDWQPLHGIWALAGGGMFGVGPGNSKAKWSWLPAADNDYIFAIIGEELGFIGAAAVIVVYVVLALAMLQVIRSARDRFGRAVVGGVLVWIVGQALVNIFVVLRILPVLGVPLPLISAGGTALISCMLAMGVVISIAKDASDFHGELAQQPGGKEPHGAEGTA